MFSMGAPTQASILFMGGHFAAVSLLFSFNVTHMSWYLALLKALGTHTLAMSALLVVHAWACKLMCSFQLDNGRQHEHQQQLEYDKGKPWSAKRRCMDTVCRPLSAQFMSKHPVVTKVLGHLVSFLSLGYSLLHAVTLYPQVVQAGCSGCKDQEGYKVIQGKQQARAQHAHTDSGTQQEQLEQEQQQQQQQQQAKACTQREVHQEQQQQQQQQQQQAKACAGTEVNQEPLGGHKWHSAGETGEVCSSAAEQVQGVKEAARIGLRAKRSASERSSATDPMQGLKEHAKLGKLAAEWSASGRLAGNRPGQADFHYAQLQDLYSQLQGTRTAGSTEVPSKDSSAHLLWTSSTPTTATSSVRASLGSADILAPHSSVHGARRAPTMWTPMTRKAISAAAHDLSRARQMKLRTNNLEADNQPLQGLQESSRIALKLNGPTTPDQIPGSGLGRLQHRLQRYQCLTAAVRSGCVVISCDALPQTSSARALEEMREAVLAEAKEWAQEQGLPEAEGDLLSVQACFCTTWDCSQPGMPLAYSMAVHAPFLAPSPVVCAPGTSTFQQLLQQQSDLAEMEQNSYAQMEHSMWEQNGLAEMDTSVQEQNSHADLEQSMQEQSQREGDLHPGSWVQEQEASCEFELTIRGPERCLLRGWQCADDAPEDLPDAIKPDSLCNLASLEGQFAPVTLLAESLNEVGERTVQVCVNLPGKSYDDDEAPLCPKALTLELWATGNLVCSYSAVLLSPYSTAGAAALAELQGWAAGLIDSQAEGSGPFMRDLVRWMRFLAYTQQQQQQQQSGQMLTKDAGLTDAPSVQQRLETMKSVGMSLLAFSLEEGMEGVAGLLLECFCSLPFCIPPLALLDAVTNAAHEGNQGALPTLDQAIPISTRHGEVQSPGSQSSIEHSSTQSKANPARRPFPAAFSPCTPRGAPASATTPSSALSRASAHPPPAAWFKPIAAARDLHALLFQEVVDYGHSWSHAQVAVPARAWCRVSLLGMCLGGLRKAWIESVPLMLLTETCSWGPSLLGYTLGAIFIKPGSAMSGVILAAVSVLRASYNILVGTGTLPLITTHERVLRMRLEVVGEVLVTSIMERVRLKWMVPLRILLMVGYWLAYVRLSMPLPFMQSVLVNGSSLAVTVVVDRWYSNLYSSRRTLGKQALADEGEDGATVPGLCPRVVQKGNKEK